MTFGRLDCSLLYVYLPPSTNIREGRGKIVWEVSSGCKTCWESFCSAMRIRTLILVDSPPCRPWPQGRGFWKLLSYRWRTQAALLVQVFCDSNQFGSTCDIDEHMPTKTIAFKDHLIKKELRAKKAGFCFYLMELAGMGHRNCRLFEQPCRGWRSVLVAFGKSLAWWENILEFKRNRIVVILYF